MATYTGEQILAERKRRKLSRREMGELTGFSQGVIANLEGGREPKPSEVGPLEAFMSGAEMTPAPPPPAQDTPADTPADSSPADITGDVIIESDEEEDWESFVTVIASPATFTPQPAEPPPPEFVPPQATEPLQPKPVPVVVGRLISNSEVQTYKRCKRKWWLAWHRHLRMKTESPTGARAIGTWVHRALQQWYVPEGEVRTDPREALERVLLDIHTGIITHASLLAEKSDDGGFAAESMMQQFKKDADLARAMVEGYVDWIATTAADSGYRVISSEEMITSPFDVEHDEAVHIVGKLDVRVEREIDNVRLFMDHKTVASIDKATKMLHMNEQMLHYRLLEMRQFTNHPGGDGHFVDGALYNMLRKVKRTERAKPPFYQRIEVRHNNHEVNAYVKHLTSTVTEMLATQRALSAQPGNEHMLVPPTPNDSCSWQCDFYAVCPMFDDGSRAEDMISQYFTVTEHLDYYGDSLNVNDAETE